MDKTINNQLSHIVLSELRVATVSYSDTFSFEMKYGLFLCEYGIVMIAAYGNQITALEFNDTPYLYKETAYERDDDHLLKLLKEDLNLLLIGTPFQQEVWKALLTIERTITYSGLAQKMNRPTATRAVASAIAKNRISYFVPCHRVVPMAGPTGNYRWGKSIKKELLQRESFLNKK